MKYFTLFPSILILLLIATMSYSQIDQGVFRLGGDFSLDHQTVSIELPGVGEDSYNSTVVMIEIEPGYFVSDQFLIGVNLGYTSLSYEDEIEGREFLIGPKLSYYINSGNKEVYFPISIFGGYNSQIFDYGVTIQDDETSGFYYGGNIGIEYIPGGNLGLRISFGPQIRNYEISNSDLEVTETTWQFRLGMGYYFTKKEESE